MRSPAKRRVRANSRAMRRDGLRILAVAEFAIEAGKGLRMRAVRGGIGERMNDGRKIRVTGSRLGGVTRGILEPFSVSFLDILNGADSSAMAKSNICRGDGLRPAMDTMCFDREKTIMSRTAHLRIPFFDVQHRAFADELDHGRTKRLPNRHGGAAHGDVEARAAAGSMRSAMPAGSGIACRRLTAAPPRR